MNTNDAPNILITDTNTADIRLMLETLAARNIRGLVSDNACSALEIVEKHQIKMAVIANSISPRKGQQPAVRNSLELMRKIISLRPNTPVVMLGAVIDDRNELIAVAVNAVKNGCCEYLLRPLSKKNFENLIDTLITDRSSGRPNPAGLPDIIGTSEILMQTLRLAGKAAISSVPVCITGESGTGKELISHYIHINSPRAGSPYIKVNCAALSETLLESELFGHEKGAFTGAWTQRPGRFELADGGTLLLDEITETPMSFQAKLLRVIEQQDFERVGGAGSIRVNVRIICTTNRDLQTQVRGGKFREDLYYRLSPIRIVVPPLRKRREDIAPLVRHFVRLYAVDSGRYIEDIDPQMMRTLENYSWPGNVRQLRNVIISSLILGTGPMLSMTDMSWLTDEIACAENKNESSCRIKQTTLAGITLEDIERQAILQTLDSTGGNRTLAAKSLGISDRTLRDKISRYKNENILQTAGLSY